jgi:hypothetical protein
MVTKVPTLDKPQIIIHAEKSLNYTPFDVKWVPCSARFVVVGQKPRGTGSIEVYEIEPGDIKKISEVRCVSLPGRRSVRRSFGILSSTELAINRDDRADGVLLVINRGDRADGAFGIRSACESACHQQSLSSNRGDRADGAFGIRSACESACHQQSLSSNRGDRADGVFGILRGSMMMVVWGGFVPLVSVSLILVSFPFFSSIAAVSGREARRVQMLHLQRRQPRHPAHGHGRL